MRHGMRSLTLGRGIDERDGVRFERLDFELRLGLPHGTALRLTVWEDSQSWLCLRQHQKKVGWTFKLELQLDLWDLNGPEIVRRIEATVTHGPSKVGPLDPHTEGSIRAIWSSKQRPPRKKRK